MVRTTIASTINRDRPLNRVLRRVTSRFEMVRMFFITILRVLGMVIP